MVDNLMTRRGFIAAGGGVAAASLATAAGAAAALAQANGEPRLIGRPCRTALSFPPPRRIASGRTA
jgi:hypothetical protein